jgi:LmbE family N-acetylglucosaminyl deacetylase
MKKRVLAIFAHPDDVELMCAGTLSLLKKKGWEIHIATMTLSFFMFAVGFYLLFLRQR